MNNLEEIYIIGASGFAIELYNLIITENFFLVAGFIDKNPKIEYIKLNDCKVPVINESRFLTGKSASTKIAFGIGDPKILKEVYRKFISFELPNIISSKAVVGPGVKLGKGNIITQGVIFTTNISIGDCNIFNLSSTIGHDVNLGNFNVVNPSVNISGGVKIGDGNLLGVGSIILQYKTLGNHNVIGASSLVTKDVGNEKLIIGIPGKEKDL